MAVSSHELVSVVVLTYNGGELLERVLQRLREQEIPGELELVLVDSGSTDGSEKLEPAVRIAPEDFRFGLARDAGFEASHGRYIATISQDYLPADEHWLERMVAPLRSGADVTLGAAEAWPDRRPFYWETRRFWFTREGRRFNGKYGGRAFSCVALATRSEVWRESGGFGRDTPYSEDKRFQRAAHEAGFRGAVYVPEAVGFHGHRYDLRSLAKRCENEGFGWRFLGEPYSMWDLALDLLAPANYAKLVLGLLQGRVRTPAELLFPWIRPIWLFRGNRWGQAWKR